VTLVALNDASREEGRAEVLGFDVERQGEWGTSSLHGLKMRASGWVPPRLRDGDHHCRERRDGGIGR
jgi:hypothetical protein